MTKLDVLRMQRAAVSAAGYSFPPEMRDRLVATIEDGVEFGEFGHRLGSREELVALLAELDAAGIAGWDPDAA